MDKISIAFMTNCSVNSPNIKIQKQTIESFYSTFKVNGVISTYIFIDPKPNPERIDEYVKNLKTIEQFKNATVIKTIGLTDGYLKIFEHVKTPYVFFLEHDWKFQNVKHDINGIVSLFESSNAVNCILFNKRKNMVAGSDKILTRHPNLPLILTNRQSNNPHCFRVSFAKDHKAPLIKRRDTCSVHSNYCLGIECEAEDHIKFNREKIKLFGTHLYGEMNHPPTLIHLDGRKKN